jgi:hypothetical protein
MSRRIILAIIALILIAAGVIWLVQRNKNNNTVAPVLSVSAYNQTKNKSATDMAANPGDVIVYTLKAENQSDKTISGYVMEASIAEITDKASLLDASGASYNAATNSLVWTPLDIPAHESITKEFRVSVNQQAVGNRLRVKFNNEVEVAVVSTPVVSGAKNPDNTDNYKAPKTGASEWLPALFAVLFTAAWAFRKKLMGITFSR